MSTKKRQVFTLIRENPFISQQEIADQLALSRSAVGGYISTLMKEGLITGRAYVLAEEKRITCIGGANIDRKIQSIAPIHMETSNPASTSQSYGGVARNIAENLARLQCQISLVSSFGRDKEGEAIIEHCRKLGIDTRLSVLEEEDKTGNYTAVLSPEGDLALALADMHIYDRFTIEKMQNRWQDISSSEMLVVDSNLPADTLEYLIQQAASDGVMLCLVSVSVPKANRIPKHLKGTYLLIANEDEAAAIANCSISNEQQLIESCRQIIHQGCEQVIVTRGAKGVFCMSTTEEYNFLPAKETKVVDVTGAGDAFAAGVVYAIRQNKQDLKQACYVGMECSTLTLQSKETVSPILSEQLIQQLLIHPGRNKDES